MRLSNLKCKILLELLYMSKYELFKKITESLISANEPPTKLWPLKKYLHLYTFTFKSCFFPALLARDLCTPLHRSYLIDSKLFREGTKLERQLTSS